MKFKGKKRNYFIHEAPELQVTTPTLNTTLHNPFIPHIHAISSSRFSHALLHTKNPYKTPVEIPNHITLKLRRKLSGKLHFEAPLPEL